jgi:hypothetical protein
VYEEYNYCIVAGYIGPDIGVVVVVNGIDYWRRYRFVVVHTDAAAGFWHFLWSKQ